MRDAIGEMSSATKIIAATVTAGTLFATWLVFRKKKPAHAKPVPAGHTSVSLLHNASTCPIAGVNLAINC